MKSQPRICFISAEVTPFAKAGGLGDVAAALPRYLNDEAGCDMRVFLPLYDSIDRNLSDFVEVDFLQDIPLQIGPHKYHFSVQTARMPNSQLWLHFIDCPAVFHRGSLYTNDADELLRFAVLSQGALESCQRMGFAADIFHCNDWQSALVPLLLKTHYAWDALFAQSRTMLTIHNIGYQGVFPGSAVHDLGLLQYTQMLHQDDLAAGMINSLKTGLMYADALTTVSPTYAQEVQHTDQGAGLQSILLQRRDVFFGILNGVDYDEWSPQLDPFIPHRYSHDDMGGKHKNRTALLELSGLQQDDDAPIFGIVSRMTHQKGHDLLFEALPAMLAHRNSRLVVLGSGEQRYTDFFHSLQSTFPGRAYFREGYDNALAHLIEAGSDFFLMPSRYEPCGLNQMYSQLYGTVPIVRNTGGLADTVQQYNIDTGEGTGVVFNDFDQSAITWALNRALDLFSDKRSWQQIVQNGMQQDFSWPRRGQQYFELYQHMLGRGGS